MYDTHPNACKGILVGPVTHTPEQNSTRTATQTSTPTARALFWTMSYNLHASYTTELQVTNLIILIKVSADCP